MVKVWTTQFHDEVTVGDEVALSLLGHPDARGRIVGEAEDGRPVVACLHCDATVSVEDFNLSMLIRRGGDAVSAEMATPLRFDYDDYCR